MRNLILLIIYFIIVNCSIEQKLDIEKYHEFINNAELLICENKYIESAIKYNEAFEYITKPFGNDVYNAALVCQLANKKNESNKYLQLLINNSNDLNKVKTTFVGKYITVKEWDQLLTNKQISYDIELRKEFKEIEKLDQLFRPMYETHDDTINANRIINLNRILQLTKSKGFPSQIELGYTESLWGQKHDIVLHHTAQRRSYDKTIKDLESILFKATKEGRFDPEKAIFYLNFQNDEEKEIFEVFSTWQHKHPLLPDSLNNKIWILKLNKSQIASANKTRKKWMANTFDEIVTKSHFLSNNNIPFIFTSVRKSIGNMNADLNKEEALEQYKLATSMKDEFKTTNDGD